MDLKSSNLSQQLKNLESRIEIPERYKKEMENSQGKNTSIFQTNRVVGWVCRPFGVWVGQDFWSAAIICGFAGFSSHVHALLSIETFWF